MMTMLKPKYVGGRHLETNICLLNVQSVEQKFIGVIFRTSRSGSDVRYS